MITKRLSIEFIKKINHNIAKFEVNLQIKLIDGDGAVLKSNMHTSQVAVRPQLVPVSVA